MKQTLGRTAAWAVVVCAMVLLAGCAGFDDTKPDPPSVFQWDKSLPREQTSLMTFVMFEPRTYNQMTLSERKIYANTGGFVARLPAGPAVFTGDIHWGQSNGRTTWTFDYKDAAFSFITEAGKIYYGLVDFEYVDQEKKRGEKRWGIRFYEWRHKEKDVDMGFILFKPQVLSD